MKSKYKYSHVEPRLLSYCSPRVMKYRKRLDSLFCVESFQLELGQLVLRISTRHIARGHFVSDFVFDISPTVKTSIRPHQCLISENLKVNHELIFFLMFHGKWDIEKHYTWVRR